jgi:LCP family protein required for cell wall assembly
MDDDTKPLQRPDEDTKPLRRPAEDTKPVRRVEADTAPGQRLSEEPARGKEGNLRRRLGFLFRPGILLPAALLAFGCLCLAVYNDIRTYAPMAARDKPMPTTTPFGPAAAGTRDATSAATVFASTRTFPTVTPLPPGMAYDGNPWSPYAGPILPSVTPIPTPAEEFPLREGVMNIALLGVDSLEADAASRTDTIMVLTLNRKDGTASLVSFPRDLFVYIPAYGMQRINLAFPQGKELHYPGGSFALLRDTLKYNFGLTIDHYLLVDFLGFRDIVDSLGGIDVHVTTELTDFRLDHGTFTVPAGEVHMDGYTALWYARSRKTTNDFDRQRRQQEIIQAIAQRLIDIQALTNLPGFFRTLAEYVESDLTLAPLTPYAELAFRLSPSDLQRYAITSPGSCKGWRTPQGMSVLLPNYEAIHWLLKHILVP